jgi:hypothetical protein
MQRHRAAGDGGAGEGPATPGLLRNLEGTYAVARKLTTTLQTIEGESRHNSVLEQGQRLFAVVSRRVSIVGPLTYVAQPTDRAYGTTRFAVLCESLVSGDDVTGPFLQYGIDEHGHLGVIYDRRNVLSARDEYSIVTGHTAA